MTAKGPRRLVRVTWSKISSVKASRSPAGTITVLPAELTRTSVRPKRCATVSAAACTLAPSLIVI